MSALNQVLSGLGVKGAVTRGGPGRGGYLIKTNDAGYMDVETLPFSISAHRTYYVDQYNAGSASAERTGSITNPFLEISEALAVNLSESQGGTPMTVILGRGSYAGFTLQSPTNNGQTSVTLVSTSPGDTIITSEIQVQTASVAVTLTLSGVRSAAISRSSNPGVFNVYLMNRAQTGNLSAISGSTGTAYIFPGCSGGARTNMTAVWMTNALETNFAIVTGTSANWTSVPTLVNAALDQLALRTKGLEDVASGNVLKLDGSSAFKDTATQLFNIRRTGFVTTVGYVMPAANASVLIPSRSGTLAVIADSAGTGALSDATWSADKLVAQFALKVSKAGDSMSGDLTLTDKALKLTEGLNTITLSAAGLTGSHAVTLGDYAGQITVMGNAFNAANQLVKLNAGTYVTNDISYTPGTSGDWSPAPALMSTAFDQLAARAKSLETSVSGGVLKLDGSSEFADSATQLFKIGRAGFKTTVAYVTPAANATVTVPNKTGILAVIDDSAGAGVLNSTWSTDKLTTQMGLKVSKAGDTMTGNLVLSNTALQITKTTDLVTKTLTITVPVISADRAVTLGDYAGEITVMGNAFNAANQLVRLDSGARVSNDTNYTPGISGNWSPAPTAVSIALDQLAARVNSVETGTIGGVLKLDGSSEFANGITQLFKIGRQSGDPLTGYRTTVAYVTPAANATVTIPNKTGILPIVDDSSGTGVLNSTWSTDKLVAQLALKLNKAGGAMTGNLILADSGLQITRLVSGSPDVTYTLGVTAPALSADHAVTFGNFSGQVTVLGNTVNAASGIIRADTDYKLPAANGSLLTGITATQAGLGNVSNNAQLTRGANDYTAGIVVKLAPVANDLLLIEDSESGGVKKYMALSAIPGFGGEANTVSNLGSTGYGLYTGKAGTDFQFKKLIAGTNTYFDVTTDSITINATGTGGGAGEGDFTGSSGSVADNFVSFGNTSGKIGKDSGYNAGSFAAASHYHTAEALTSGTLDSARLPAPGHLTKGGVALPETSSGKLYDDSGNWITLSYAAASHSHAGSDITSGTLDGDRLPAISTTKKGAVPATGTPSGKFLCDDNTWKSTLGLGDFVGPSIAVDGNIVVFDGVTGKLGKDSGSKVADFAAASHNHNASAINAGTLDSARLPSAAASTKGAIALPATSTGLFLKDDGSWASVSSEGGNFVGPSSAVDSNFVAFNTTTGHLGKDSGYSAASFAAASHNHNASAINAGTLDAARLPAPAALARGGVALPATSSGKVYTDDGNWTALTGTGDFVGPSSAVDSNFMAFNTATGKLGKDSGYSAASFAAAGHSHAGTDITSGTLDGDRLPAISTTKKGAVPATGTPSGKFLKDDGNWVSSGMGLGDFVSPASSVTNNFVAFNNSSGKLGKDSGYNASSFATTSHVHGASDITSGTLSSARLPAPAAAAKGGVALPATSTGLFYKDDGTWGTGGGMGDFTGPVGSVTDNLVSFADTTGKLGKDSGFNWKWQQQSCTDNTVTHIVIGDKRYSCALEIWLVVKIVLLAGDVLMRNYKYRILSTGTAVIDDTDGEYFDNWPSEYSGALTLSTDIASNDIRMNIDCVNIGVGATITASYHALKSPVIV